MKCDKRPTKFCSEFPACFQKYPGTRSTYNPGSILDLHSLALRIKPTLLDGLELDYMHRLAPNKSVISNYVLSHNKPSGFRFGGIYTAQMNGNIMRTPTIRADINPTTLSTNIGFLYYPFRCLRLEADLQKAANDAPLLTQTCIELCTNSFTLTSNFYDVSSNRGRATLSFLRSCSDHLSLGAELLLEWMEPNTLMSDIAFAGRYTRHSYSLAATASRQGIDISYWQRIHPRLQLASLWAWQRKANKSVGTICYQYDCQDAQVRGLLDSNLSLGLSYSSYLSQAPITMAFSLLLNLKTNGLLLGLKIILDPRGLQRGG